MAAAGLDEVMDHEATLLGKFMDEAKRQCEEYPSRDPLDGVVPVGIIEEFDVDGEVTDDSGSLGGDTARRTTPTG
jgi:hypothetical protein